MVGILAMGIVREGYENFMEASHDNSNEHEADHVFLDPSVVEIHLAKGEPVPQGTARLIWVLNQLFRGKSDA